MIIEKANANDSGVLTALTISAKAYWGYLPEQMELWHDTLIITKAYIETKCVYKLIIDSMVVGYYSFFFEREGTVKLDNVFILPEYIGKGYGRLLINDFLLRLKDTNAKTVILESDPYAENFYAKVGFRKTGLIATSIKDRYLPVMKLAVNRADDDKKEAW